jgi:serine-type D-Ala-D-Ala endopeptidase (penicillin-binding protein 7)
VQKTGFIREAGRCVVMLANISQRPVVLVLLDSVGKFSRLGDAQRVKTWMETGEVLALPAPPRAMARKGVKGTKGSKGARGLNASKASKANKGRRGKAVVVKKRRR